MSQLMLVDIEDAAGQKLGAGPIYTATNWQQTARLDRAGDFAFTMPATDARAAYCRPKRYARCWHSGGEGLKSLGYGRIERIEAQEAESGPVLSVSGVDLLGELADRIMRREGLKTETTTHPTYVDFSGTVSDGPFYDLQPGDTTTYEETDTDNGIIASSYKFHFIDYILGPTFNTAAGAAHYEYSAGGTTWTDLTVISDTTIVAGVAMAQSGRVWFTPPSDWEPLAGQILYKVRLRAPVGNWSGKFDIKDISITYWLPTIDALNQVMAYAPPGWSLDAALGYTTLQYRPLTGTELFSDPGFEEIASGTADDTNSDTWTHWVAGEVGAGRVLAVTTHHGGSYGVKLLHGAVLADFAAISQTTAANENTEYTLTYWCQGDGTNGLMLRVYNDDAPYTLDDSITTLHYATNVSTTWVQERLTFTTPPGCTGLYVVFYAPNAVAGYCIIDDVSLQAGGGNSIYLQASDESVLEMLIRVSEVSGEHFILSPDGRKVLWLGKDARLLALRAVSNASPVEVSGVDGIALITDVTETEDTGDVVSRVYPYGAGMGGNRVTLASAATEPPAGYVVSKTLGYVERTAAVAALGVIETARSWSDIVEQTDDTTASAQSAGNILLIQAVNWLASHSATSTDRLTGDVPRFYAVGLAKCEQIVLPGHKARFVHHRWASGYHAVSIDRDLWILSATWRVGKNGAETNALDVSTVDRPAINDALALATGIRRIVGMAAHNTAEGY
jgi:hypothetical protein